MLVQDSVIFKYDKIVISFNTRQEMKTRPMLKLKGVWKESENVFWYQTFHTDLWNMFYIIMRSGVLLGNQQARE